MTLPTTNQPAQIKRVTIAGTTGAIGVPIIHALSRAGFDVQALSRSTGATPGLSVRIHTVDYKDHSQLVTVLQGQDAVISCLGDNTAAVAAQEALIHASLEARVRRFLPSEFGCDTSNDYVKSLPFFHVKVKHLAILKAAAARHSDFSYTVLITGLFLDWCLSVVPCIIDCGSRTASVYDGGDIPFSVTRTAVVAAAVTNILLQPSQSRNRSLRIHEMVTSQNELIRRAQGLTDASLGTFSCAQIDTATYEDRAWRAYTDPFANPLDWMVPFINLSVWSKGQPGYFRQVDCAMLGVQQVTGTKRTHVIDAVLRAAFQRFSKQSGRLDASQLDLMAEVAQQAYEQGQQKLI